MDVSHVFPISKCSSSPFTGCVAVPGFGHVSSANLPVVPEIGGKISFGGPPASPPPAKSCNDTINRVGCLSKPHADAPTIQGATQGATYVRFSAAGSRGIEGEPSEWADLDGDGDLDCATTDAAIYLNNGRGFFTAKADAFIGEKPWQSVGWQGSNVVIGDVNGDDHMDLLIGIHVYLNDGDADVRFVRDTRGPGIADSALALVDVDNDGDLDLMNTGGISLNDGTGRFTEGSRTGCASADAKFGDFNGDGYADLFCNAVMHFNDGTGGFVPYPHGVLQSSAWSDVIRDVAFWTPFSSTSKEAGKNAVGDIDGDGDLDIVSVYSGMIGEIDVVYRNDGTGRFVTDSSTALSDANTASANVVMADVDGDGDLDVIRESDVVALFVNNGDGQFVVSTRGNLPTGVVGSFVDFDGDGDLDMYKWSAGDGAVTFYLNAGSGSFHEDKTTEATEFTKNYEFAVDFAVGDVDGDGDLDVVMANLGVSLRDAGGTGAYEPNRLYLGDGNGGLADATISHGLADSLQQMTWGVELADIDNDGDLDLLVANGKFNSNYDETKHSTDYRNRVMRNDGHGFFTEDLSTAISVPNEFSFGFVIADFNDDGYLDVIVRHASGVTSDPNRMYLGDGLGGFIEVTAANPLTSGPDQDTVCADVDGDGDIDCVMSNPLSLFKNDGTGGFGTAGFAILATAVRHSRFADVDGDGDVDMVGIVSQDAWTGLRLLMNSGSGSFTLADQTYLSMTVQCSPCDQGWGGFFAFGWGDFDKDGDVDFIASSTNHDGAGVTSIYTNDGSGVFSQDLLLGYRATETYTTSIAVLDLDGDGDLDVLEANSPLNSMYGTMDVQGLMKFQQCPDLNTARSTAYGNGCLQTCPVYAVRGGPNLDVCIECPIHNQRNADGKCVGCPPGQDRASGTNLCSACAPGFATAGGGIGCTACERGQFTPTNGSVLCTLCPGGKYQDMKGSATCKPCPAGSFCLDGATAPILCPANTYCPAESVDPLPCDINRVTDGSGASSKAECACDQGFYASTIATAVVTNTTTGTTTNGTEDVVSSRRLTSDSGFVCEPCDDTKVDCSRPGAELSRLAVRPGHWRMSGDSKVAWVMECFNPNACLGAGSRAVANATMANVSASTDVTVNVTEATNGTEAARRRLASHTSGNLFSSGILSSFSFGASFISGRSLQSIGVTYRSEATYADALCALGQTGPLCSVCETGWYGGSDNQLCVACEGNLGLAFVPMTIFIILLLICVVVFCRRGQNESDLAAFVENAQNVATDGVSATAKAAAEAQAAAVVIAEVDAAKQKGEGGEASLKDKALLFTAAVHKKVQDFMPKVKIIISLWQVLKGMGFSFAIPYPPLYQSTIDFVAGLVEIDLPSVMPLGCAAPLNFFDKLILRTCLPLVAYALLLLLARCYYKSGKKRQSGILVDAVFFIIFLVYPSTSSALFSVFVCEDLEDGSSFMRNDLSIQCTNTDGSFTGLYVGVLAYTAVMLFVQTIGTLVLYAYLCFVVYTTPLAALKAQEQALEDIDRLASNPHLPHAQKQLVVEHLAKDNKPTINAQDTLPGFMVQLVGSYDCKCYWFEIFEALRKVLLVGVPASFPDRGGNAQLVWGLLVCFLTFGMYMHYEPFKQSSNDHLSQIAQVQIFMTLVASIGLRMTPADDTLAVIVSGLLFVIPVIAFLQETGIFDMLQERVARQASKSSSFIVTTMQQSRMLSSIPRPSLPSESSADVVRGLTSGVNVDIDDTPPPPPAPPPQESKIGPDGR